MLRSRNHTWSRAHPRRAGLDLAETLPGDPKFPRKFTWAARDHADPRLLPDASALVAATGPPATIGPSLERYAGN